MGHNNTWENGSTWCKNLQRKRKSVWTCPIPNKETLSAESCVHVPQAQHILLYLPWNDVHVRVYVTVHVCMCERIRDCAPFAHLCNMLIFSSDASFLSHMWAGSLVTAPQASQTAVLPHLFSPLPWQVRVAGREYWHLHAAWCYSVWPRSCILPKILHTFATWLHTCIPVQTGCCNPLWGSRIAVKGLWAAIKVNRWPYRY